MDIAEYQAGTAETVIYRDGIEIAILSPHVLKSWLALDYCTDKLVSEAAELSQEVSKALRDDAAIITSERKEKIFKELGDNQWYASQICNELGFKLEDVMYVNLAKLRDRKERDMLQGSGSSR